MLSLLKYFKLKSQAKSLVISMLLLNNIFFNNEKKTAKNKTKTQMVTFYQLHVSALFVTLVILLLASLKITLAFLNVFGNLATVVKWRSVCCFPCQWMLFSSVSPFPFTLNVQCVFKKKKTR